MTLVSTVQRPHGHDNSEFIVSISGGKDSTATTLALRETGIDAQYVFADTGWEARETYDYLNYLENSLNIKINRVGVDGGMVAKARARAGFPARVQRWCTVELKIEPIKKFHESLDCETVSVVGVRSEESPSRARLPEFEFDDEWGGYVWRPLINWTIADVLNIHNRHGIKVNPLYQQGFSRVGCFPCIFSNKDEINLWATHSPERVEEIDRLERELTDERKLRNLNKPGRYSYEQATFFMSKTTDSKGKYIPMGIREIVAWSKTSRGGRQLQIIQDEPTTGCFRWGLCDKGSNK